MARTHRLQVPRLLGALFVAEGVEHGQAQLAPRLALHRGEGRDLVIGGGLGLEKNGVVVVAFGGGGGGGG